MNLTVEQMKQLARIGIRFNFTYDEISAMLGEDPGKMYAAIREVGVQHFTLSSDCGDALLPNSVEAMRQLGGSMAAFGMMPHESETVCIVNPCRIVGADAGEALARDKPVRLRERGRARQARCEPASGTSSPEPVARVGPRHAISWETEPSPTVTTT